MAVKITFTGDDASLGRVIDSITDKSKKQEKQFDRTGDAATKANNETTRSAKAAETANRRQLNFAKSLVRQNETATQTYKRQYAALRTAWKQGTITGNQFKQTTDQLKTKLRGVGDEAQKTGTKIKGGLDVRTIGKYVASLGAIAAAWRVARGAAEAYNEAKERAIAEADSLADGRRRLAQVAAPGEYAELMKQADDLAKNTGMTREEGANMMFNAKSTGFSFEDAGFLGMIRDQISTETTMGFGKLQRLYGGKRNVREIAGGLTVAAEGSVASIEDIARAAPMIAESAAPIGIAPAEQMSVLAGLSADFKSPDVAANRMKAFYAKLNSMKYTRDFKGLDTMQMVDKLTAWKTGTDAQRSNVESIMGSQEVEAAFNALQKNRGAIQTLTPRIAKDMNIFRRDELGTGSLLDLKYQDTYNKRTLIGQQNILRRDAAKATNVKAMQEEYSTAATALEDQKVKDEQTEKAMQKYNINNRDARARSRIEYMRGAGEYAGEFFGSTKMERECGQAGADMGAEGWTGMFTPRAAPWHPLNDKDRFFRGGPGYQGEINATDEANNLLKRNAEANERAAAALEQNNNRPIQNPEQ